jgi:hypothetical protein
MEGADGGGNVVVHTKLAYGFWGHPATWYGCVSLVVLPQPATTGRYVEEECLLAAQVEKRPADMPFGMCDPDRLVYRLYKVEPSTPTKWVYVDT